MANLLRLAAFAAAGPGDAKLDIVRLNDVRRIHLPAAVGMPRHERLGHEFGCRQLHFGHEPG